MPVSTTPVPHPSFAANASSQAQHLARIGAIDVMRGLVMLIMLIASTPHRTAPQQVGY